MIAVNQVFLLKWWDICDELDERTNYRGTKKTN